RPWPVDVYISQGAVRCDCYRSLVAQNGVGGYRQQGVVAHVDAAIDPQAISHERATEDIQGIRERHAVECPPHASQGTSHRAADDRAEGIQLDYAAAGEREGAACVGERAVDVDVCVGAGNERAITVGPRAAKEDVSACVSCDGGLV